MKNATLTVSVSISLPCYSFKSLKHHTYQNSGDYICPVQKSICVIAGPYEAGCGHILLIFIPVANLGKGQCVRGATFSSSTYLFRLKEELKHFMKSPFHKVGFL
ncbi:hypothetical protein ILYODFUR_015965 [Ilyodon furcidens]|uniref:Uncharacterized protein n=1 Tax=Ilyodon furcidens TaxID=33524 RepID=A0ABV0TK58_9TELE